MPQALHSPDSSFHTVSNLYLVFVKQNETSFLSVFSSSFLAEWSLRFLVFVIVDPCSRQLFFPNVPLLLASKYPVVSI